MRFKRLNSYQSKGLYQEYFKVSQELGDILNISRRTMANVSRRCENATITGNAGMFLRENKARIHSEEVSGTCHSIGDFANNKLGLTSNPAMLGFLFAKNSIVHKDVTSFANRDSGLFRTRFFKPGTKIIFNNRNNRTLSIDAASIMGELNGELNQNIALYGRFTNSVIFRHVDVDGRRISIINRGLPSKARTEVEKDFKAISKKFYGIYNSLHLVNKSVGDSVVGFVKGKSYIDHARSHLGCVSAASIDISKFYDSISLVNIIENNLFYKSLCASFMHKTGLAFEPESFKHSIHYFILEKIFATMNVQFIAAMNFLTHNGLLPTGAHYSPNVSNLVLGSLDFDILNMLSSSENDIKYTRYADDMCVSSTRAKDANGEYIINMDLIKNIENVVRDNGFYLNYNKTEIMGPKDRKRIAGIVLDTTSGEHKLSIGSDKKLELRREFQGRVWSSLDESERGTISWVNTINPSQHAFICEGIYEMPEANASPDVTNSDYEVMDGSPILEEEMPF